MSPRASALARRLDKQLAAIEQAGGAASRRDWTEQTCREISEPSHGKLPQEMSDDELHRELERRKTVEAHIKQIFAKLAIDAGPASNRRVLAVLAFLRD
jgi:hypothetical protein